MSIWILAGVILLLSLAGGLPPVLLRTRLRETRMRTLTTIGAGFLLGSALLIVIPEGFHVAEEAAEDGDGVVGALLGAALLAGFTLMLLLEGLGVGHSVHEEHHDHAGEHGHDHVHHPTSAVTVPIGLSVHAIADGLAIGAAAASGEEAAAALVAVAVLLHKVPAAFSLGVFSSHERATRRLAMRDVVAFSAVTPVALLIAAPFFEEGSTFLAAILLFSAGTFLYVATVDTLPALHTARTGRHTAFEVALGAAIFTALLTVFDFTGLITELH